MPVRTVPLHEFRIYSTVTGRVTSEVVDEQPTVPIEVGDMVMCTEQAEYDKDAPDSIVGSIHKVIGVNDAIGELIFPCHKSGKIERGSANRDRFRLYEKATKSMRKEVLVDGSIIEVPSSSGQASIDGLGRCIRPPVLEEPAGRVREVLEDGKVTVGMGSTLDETPRIEGYIVTPAGPKHVYVQGTFRLDPREKRRLRSRKLLGRSSAASSLENFRQSADRAHRADGLWSNQAESSSPSAGPDLLTALKIASAFKLGPEEFRREYLCGSFGNKETGHIDPDVLDEVRMLQDMDDGPKSITDVRDIKRPGYYTPVKLPFELPI